MAQQCLFLLLVLAVATQVHSQLDSHGFLSIDCGLYRVSSYVDSFGLTYLSDEKFIDTGVISNISSSIIAQYGDTISREFLTLRYFPTGSRNCYTLKPLTIGRNYLIRALFYYANYDSLYEPPIFDIYLGVNFWQTIDANDTSFSPEMIFTATADFVQVCLVNKNQGTPFISSLHLRQFKSGMYTYANSSKSLILVKRNNFGGQNLVTGYSDDTYDRWWWNDTMNTAWTIISTSSKLNFSDDDFQVPPLVLQTAVATSSIQKPLSFSLSTNQSAKYYFIFYFDEIQKPSSGRREMDIYINGIKLFKEPIIPSEYTELYLWVTDADSGHSTYNISLQATSNSTLPPLLNAFEQYIVAPVLGISTDAKDVAAINSVKEYHKIKKGWSGDPCLPVQFLWSGIICSTNSPNIERITSLNLSSSNLTGSLSDSIGNLTALQYLYLSNNSLSGSLPSSLDSLTSLKLLDIRGNSHLSTILPPELESKRQNKFLDYRYGDIITPPPASPKKNTLIIAIAVAVPVLVIAVVITVVLVLKRQRDKKSIVAVREIETHPPSPPPLDHENIYPADNHVWKPQPEIPGHFFPKPDSLTFSYSDLKRITNNFNHKIGTGGYGSVFLGHLENGLQVAVKMLSQSSGQGFKEFLAEAENLARVHHKNLVLLMGYCTDKNCMALVYEYMQEGSLQNKLKDNATPLSWKQRLQIAYESAQGLEYLHNSCNPPLIHRDVKTGNILLNANFEAKIGDFGLSRAFDNNMNSRVSTRVVGTVGYMDPEYYLSNQLSAKSDVFSFGVVLLELITGRPPIVSGIEGGNLVQWVRHKLSGGYIESIVDPNIRGKYDINSVWKVADLACKCTESTSSKRPTMSAVVAELKESLDLEMAMEQHMERTDNFPIDISQNSTIEMSTFMPLAGPNMR